MTLYEERKMKLLVREKMAIVFNIQHFSIHDGPGIRTVVFLKGCPMRCKWCANPESQISSPEIGWTRSECIRCGECIKGLKNEDCRFEEDTLFWDTDISPDAEAIRTTCPSGALHVIGEERSIPDVMTEVEKDIPFYRTSGGGVTISGGEPLMQSEFTYGILRMAGEMGINRAIETCSFSSWDIYKKVLSEVDFLLTDVKLMDENRHREWTGVSNDVILENLRRARQTFPHLPIQIRTPVIPGVNDTMEDIDAIIQFVCDISADYELLPYHRLGIPKYESLHRKYPMGDVTLSAEKFHELESFAVCKLANANNSKYGQIENVYPEMIFSDGGGI